MQSVDRIWFERGEWKDISEESLLQLIEKENGENELDDGAEGQLNDENSLLLPNVPPAGYDIGKLRESVINKLFHAKSEIDVALDVINILAAGNRSSSSVKDLVLPNGSLTATYVTKPKQTTKSQLESVQLNLGLKRKKQKQASDFLKKSAASLKNIVEKEQVFWDEALDLRRNNWMMQANTMQHGGIQSSSFYVHYGFTEVGSDFNEASVGELKRAEDNSKKLQMSLPHGKPKKVSVRISQSHTGKLGLGQQSFSEGILGIETSNESDQNTKDDYSSAYTTSTMKVGHSEIQNQLAEAYSTVFDAELFSDILAEAQALNSNVRFPDDEIVINIDGQIDLSILKLNSSSTQTTNSTTTQQIISRTIDLSFRLLLLQHQKYNMWRTRAKILSPNHKIHQLLLQKESSSSVTSATGTPNPAVNNNNANNNNNINNSNNTNTNNIPNNNTSNATAAVVGGGAVGNTMVGTNNASVPINNSSGNGALNVIPATTPTPIAAAGATGASSASSVQRARTKLASHNQLTRDLPKEISILLPIMSLTRFWVQFDRIRHVVHSIISPLSGGLSISVHFKFSDYLISQLSQSNITYNAYPGYTETALSLGISILKGPSLHFALNQSGAISVYLPQTTVILQNVSEFEAFLSREIKVICLRIICDVANDMIRRNEIFQKVTGSDKQRLLWKVDQVDEAIHGSIHWYGEDWNDWRNINICLQLCKDEVIPYYNLHFRLCSIRNVNEEIHSIQLGRLDSVNSALNFKERASVIIEKIMNDAIMTKV
ncbi:unnamed protein product [Mucor hiemalis]